MQIGGVSRMDFGEMGLDGLVGPAEGEASMVSESEARGKGPAVDGSSHAKQQRSWAAENEGGPSKLTRNEDLDAPRTMPLHSQRAPMVRSNSGHEQMLSFSNNKSEVNFLRAGVFEREIQVPELPFYQRNINPPPPPASATPVYNRSADPAHPPDLNLSLNGLLIRGPFTPSQWMELEHQALIYKYMTQNTPVPSNLLISVKRSLYPLGFPPSSTWGSYNLGFSGNNDPEPGRCRRTDGKKWRCSRDSVADQKYCERHINRGRHRSRKPVEGQPGQAASGTTNSKGGKITSSMTKSVMPSNGTSNSVKTAQHQLKSLQAAGVTNPPADAIVNRMQDPRGLSMMPAPTVVLKSNNSSFNTAKQAIPVEESSQSEFGLVSTDSLLNPSHRSPYISKDYGGSFLDFSDQASQDQHQLRQFIDDWPKDQSSNSVSTWPDEIKSDWTQLSMSIPMTSSEFSSSSSPTQEKLALSPLSREFKPTQMTLGVTNDFGQSSEKKTNWIPISWRNSMGGPLGEVLTKTASCGMTCNNSTLPLDLLNEEWEGSPQMGSSPTGVLQKSAFCSLSNSSSGSSPRGENNMSFDGASIYDDMLSSTFASSSFPSL